MAFPYLCSMNNSYRVLGVMSGSSLDGLDVTLCRFWMKGERWYWEIAQATTLEYPGDLAAQLAESPRYDLPACSRLDATYGRWVGAQLRLCLEKWKERADFAAVHGHTVLHAPKDGYSLQLGSGHHIAAALELPVVADFRNADIALGGQGAPLVPVGDRDLFPEYDAWLNLGGIANATYRKGKEMHALDICPFNQVLNHWAGQVGKPYDDGGELARSGSCHTSSLEQWKAQPWFAQSAPKSLSNQWVQQEFIPLTQAAGLSAPDALRTATELFAQLIAEQLNGQLVQRMLVTGGGAWNRFFMAVLSEKCQAELTVPDAQVVNYKEALVFAYLGLLCWMRKANVNPQTTGASRHSIGGVVYGQ